MTMVHRLNESPELMAQYREWLKHPMTEFAVQATREKYAPRMPVINSMKKPIETLAALFAEQAGIETGLQTMISLDHLPDGGADIPMDYETRHDEGGEDK